MPKYTAEVESTLISAILGQARPQDSFALLTSGGRADEVGFGSNLQQFQTVLSTLSENARQKGSSSLDTLDYALRHFGELQDGDAVLLLSMGFEAESDRANYGKIQRELEQRQIRVFGFQLGTEIVGYYSTEITNIGGRLGVSTSTFPNETTLFNMAWESGGYMIQENTEGAPWKEYKFNDDRRQRLEINARRAYQAMFHFYRLRLGGGGSKNLSLSLSSELQKRYPTAKLSYPQPPSQCLK